MNKVGLLPVSLGKKEFHNKENMEFYVRYLDDNFPKSHVLIIDHPKRYNLMALEETTEEEALRRIRINSDNLAYMLSPLTANTSVAVDRFLDFWDENSEVNLRLLKESYERDQLFREDCQGFVNLFLEGAQKRRKSEEKDLIPELKDYFLEELALLSSISLIFPLVEVYPGKTELEERLYGDAYSFSQELRFDRERGFWTAFAEEDTFRDPLKVGKKKDVGRTLYARRDFHKGEFVLRLEGPLIARPNLYTIPIDDSLYLDPKNIGKFLCHSCEPSCGIRNRNEVVAMRDINAGEEIAIDYAMIVPRFSSDLLEQDIACNCGTGSCRGKFGSWEELSGELKEKYKNFASGYVLGQ